MATVAVGDGLLGVTPGETTPNDLVGAARAVGVQAKNDVPNWGGYSLVASTIIGYGV